MDNDYRSRRKADLPILFRAPAAQAEREVDQPAPRALADEQAVPLSTVETAPAAQQQAETTPGTVDLHLLYLLLWWVQQQIEQEAAAQAAEAAEPIIMESLPVEDARSVPPTRRRHALPWLVLVGCSLCLLALLSFAVGARLSATTTVTLIPTQATLSTTTSVTIATGQAKTSLPAIPGRLLSTLTLSQARTVPATGIGHQTAQAAHGRVTFYNAALMPQTIPAGTLLVGSDGTEIVTDRDVLLPAASPPSEGQVTVSAHTVEVGPQGNVGAGDLHGACCRESVFVENGAAFAGGQNASTYPMVSRHDLDSAVASLTAALDTSIQAAYSAQLTASEALVTPVACTPRVTSSSQVGDEAQALTVTFTDTCTGVAYDQQALQSVLLAGMSEQAQARLGGNPTLLGNLQVNVQQVERRGSAFILSVQGSSVWAYQFSSADLRYLSLLVAGKSQQQATTLLLHQPGVSEVAMSASALPANPQQIRVLVLYRPV